MARISIVGWIVKKIRHSIAIVQDTDTATQDIAKGKYVIWKSDLYKVTTAININDTLSTSTNLTAVSDGLGGEIKSLNDQIEIESINLGFTGVSCYKQGNVVTIYGKFDTSPINVSAGTTHEFGRVQSSLRPTGGRIATGVALGLYTEGRKFAFCCLEGSNGALSVQSPEAIKITFFSLTYILN